MTRRLSLLLANLLLLIAVIVMTYANIPRAPHLCLSNLGADWQKTRIIRTHVKNGLDKPVGLTQLAGREPHIWRVIGQNTPYMAVGMTQLGPNCVTPNAIS